MCKKELRLKIAGLSEFQAKIALYGLCNSPPTMVAQVEKSVDTAQTYQRSEG